MLATSTHGAQAPATVKHYTFELVTLNLAHRERRHQAGASLQIDLPSALTDEELETVKSILESLQASPPDGAGFRSFTMPNGTRGRIGGFIEDPEVSGAGVRSLPVELAVNGEFSTTEAALILRIASNANLFVSSSADATLVATTYPVLDRAFRKEHPRATVTTDEGSLAQWIRQNIPAQERQAP